MSFSFQSSYLDPEDLALLTHVLDRITAESASTLDDLDRHFIAGRLLSAFNAGKRDEDELLRLGSTAGAA